MQGFPDRRQVEALRARYPEGTRVRVDFMEDLSAVPPGTAGSVAFVDDAGQIHVRWDNGRTLALIPGVDDFETVCMEDGHRPGM